MTWKEKREAGFSPQIVVFLRPIQEISTEIAAKSALKSGANLRGIPKYKARSHKTSKKTRLYFICLY
jgi:hypothetical protein